MQTRIFSASTMDPRILDKLSSRHRRPNYLGDLHGEMRLVALTTLGSKASLWVVQVLTLMLKNYWCIGCYKIVYSTLLFLGSSLHGVYAVLLSVFNLNFWCMLCSEIAISHYPVLTCVSYWCIWNVGLRDRSGLEFCV